MDESGSLGIPFSSLIDCSSDFRPPTMPWLPRARRCPRPTPRRLCWLSARPTLPPRRPSTSPWSTRSSTPSTSKSIWSLIYYRIEASECSLARVCQSDLVNVALILCLMRSQFVFPDTNYNPNVRCLRLYSVVVGVEKWYRERMELFQAYNTFGFLFEFLINQCQCRVRLPRYYY